MRKAIGLLLVILGILGTMTVIGAVFGIPMILLGGILLFIGDGSPNVVLENKNTSSSENERRIECPYCSEFIKETAKVCRFCGRDLPENHIKKIAQKYICIHCDKTISPNLDNCPYCKVELFYCDNCQSYVKKDDAICTFCGIVFDEKDKEKVVNEEREVDEEKFRGFLTRIFKDKTNQ
ncbi:MAG: zinc ribbon domain-containing protein [Bacteroidetes bacterium]|nr:zinc ribbon domain-containing protein [Bacteroidota bacterium]